MIKPPYSPAFDAAWAILADGPLPVDAEQQLVELETQVTPEEMEYFGDVWEAYYAKGGLLTIDNPA